MKSARVEQRIARRLAGVLLPAPMLLHEGRRPFPFGEPDWTYEIKYDGYRLVAGVSGGRVVLHTRNGAQATRWFPELVDGLASLSGGPHVLDGEVCVLDDIGRSDFDRLHERARRRVWYPGCDPVVFCAFDLLVHDGRSLVSQPLRERKKALQHLLRSRPRSVLYVGHFGATHGADLYAQAEALKLEGIVAKRADSPYLPGQRSTDWIKCKRPGAVPPERFRKSAAEASSGLSLDLAAADPD